MNLILFSVTTFAVLDYFYRFMRFVSTDLAKIAKFLCFYSKSGLVYSCPHILEFEQHCMNVGKSYFQYKKHSYLWFRIHL